MGGAWECWFLPLRKEGFFGQLSRAMTVFKGNVKTGGPIFSREWVGAGGGSLWSLSSVLLNVKSSELALGGG